MTTWRATRAHHGKDTTDHRSRPGESPFAPESSSSTQTPGAAIAIDGDDLAGTVTGPSGPEAGVWVIAQTNDLPTPFARIVVTDDRGRYLVPDLPKANYSVWVRGYGLTDSPKIQTAPGKTLDLKAVPASSPAAAAQVLPGLAVAGADGDPGQERVPGHRRQRQRHQPEHEDAGRLDPPGEVWRVHRVPRARHERHQGDSDRARSVSHQRCGVGAAHQVGAGGRADERTAQQLRPRARAEDVRRLDGQDQGGRAPAGAAAAAGRRAERRHHAVGLGRSEGVSARRRLDRPAQPAGEPERPGVRRAGTERRLHAGAESGHAHGDADPVDGPRSEHAADQSRDAGAVAVLGRRADLDQQEQRPQPDARSQGPGVADVDGPAGGQSRRLQGWFDATRRPSSSRSRTPAATSRSTTRGRRS